MKKVIFTLAILGIAVCLSGPLMAQPQSDQGASSNGGSSNTCPTGAPIGGGTGILLVLAVAYAISGYSSEKKEI